MSVTIPKFDLLNMFDNMNVIACVVNKDELVIVGNNCFIELTADKLDANQYPIAFDQVFERASDEIGKPLANNTQKAHRSFFSDGIYSIIGAKDLQFYELKSTPTDSDDEVLLIIQPKAIRLDESSSIATIHLEEAQANFENLFYQSPIPKTTYSLQGHGIEAANHSALVFFECPDAESLIGKNLIEISTKTQNGEPSHKLFSRLKASTDREKVFTIPWTFKTYLGNEKEGVVSINRITLHGVETMIVSINDLTEIRQREKELSQLQSEYKYAQQIAKVGSWVKRLKDKTEYFSPVAKTLLGFSQNQSPTIDDFLTLIGAEDSQAIRNGLKGLTKSKSFFDHNILSGISTPDNKPLNLELRFNYHSNGLGDSIVGSIHDVTARNAALELARESSKRNEAINEATPNIVYIFCLENFSNIYSNKHIGEITGYSSEEIHAFGSEFLPKLIHPEDKPTIDKHFSNIFASADGQVNMVEYRILNKSGNYSWLNSREVVFKRNSQNIPSQTLGVAHDITDRKLAELRIIDQNFKIQSILQSSKASICSLDINLKVVFYNTLFKLFIEEINPNSQNEVENGIYLEDVFDTTDRFEKFKFAISKSTIVGETRFQIESTSPHGGFDGGNPVYMIKINPIFIGKYNSDIPDDADYLIDLPTSDSKTLKGYSIFVNDISELVANQRALVAAREEAESANRAKSLFLANMSHEIRTPMNAILGFSEIMVSHTDDKQQQNYAKSILGSGKALMNVINDILDISKIDAGKLQIRPEFEDLNSLLIELNTIFSLEAKKAGISFHVVNDTDLSHRYLFDSLRLRQILNNLLANAIKFTETGSVTLLTQTAPSSENPTTKVDLSIKVIDTGIGIPSNELERVFQPFVQQDAQEAKKYGGTGLGLPISRSLVEMMGGQLNVESKLGQGSVFEVNLPDISFSSSNEKPDDPQPSQVKILSVDDSNLNQLIIKGILSKQNYDMIFASEAKKAMEIIQDDTPDFIIMDVQLPGMSGIELTTIIRQWPELEGVPIIAATSYDFESNDEEMNLFDEIIYKPVSSSKLITLIEKHINGSETNAKIATGEPAAEMIETVNTPQQNITLAEYNKFSPTINRLSLTMELDLIDDLATLMIAYYTGLPSVSDVEKNRTNYFVSLLNSLKTAISDFDIDTITGVMNKLKITFNNYHEY